MFSAVRFTNTPEELISKRTPCKPTSSQVLETQQYLTDYITSVIAPEKQKDTDPSLPQWHGDETHVYHGCKHYLRECKIECSQCKRFFACRLCHDKIADHKIDRTQTTRVFCYRCHHIVPFALNCSNCGIQFAIYKCDDCRFLNGNPYTKVFHCKKCLIC